MTVLLASLLLNQLTAKKEGWWEISVRYPRFGATGPVAKAANNIASTREGKAFRDFVALAKADMPGLRKDGSAGHYELEIKPHRITDRANLASGYVDQYDYRAGAHGTSFYDAINVGRIDGKVRTFGLRELFRRGEDAVGQASRAIIAILKSEKDLVPTNVAQGSWTRLTKEQADRFVVGPNGILFLFDQYDLGVGAEGPRQVLVPFNRLPGLDRLGILKSVAPPS